MASNALTHELDTMTAPTPPAYDFTPTQDWFSGNIDRWRALFPRVTAAAPRALEIGTWEGRSSVFLLEELCKKAGELVTIDHYDLLQTDAGRARRTRVAHNLRLAGGRARVVEAFSVPGLMAVLRDEAQAAATAAGFDWIYVDGSHRADDTFLDGELVWRLARKGAIIVFDDYRWPTEDPESMLHPRRGIDAFLALHAGELERLSGEGEYQMIVQKRTEMRIGWAYAGAAPTAVASALDYGVNLALAVDSAYAMPATVAISSALRTLAPGVRCTVYVLDCGLSAEDRRKVGAVSSEPVGERASVVFLESDADDLWRSMGSASWGKIDLVRRVPVEKVLYLDADVLVTGDLAELWRTELEGNAIGAAPDVGHPTRTVGGKPSDDRVGSFAAPARPTYFNAGVLLMDLAKMRRSIGDLLSLAQSSEALHFKDQDVLNAHFAGKWTELPLKYNAQGLGTYADRLTAERELLDLDEMRRSPVVVHFTGPVHPPLVKALNPWVQPCTAKPWGYAGAPGHPHSGAWWEALGRTAWKGIRDTPEFKAREEAAKRAVFEAAQEKFFEAFPG